VQQRDARLQLEVFGGQMRGAAIAARAGYVCANAIGASDADAAPPGA
jgi:hypothetical protein